MRKFISVILALTLIFSLSVQILALNTPNTDSLISDVASYLRKAVKEPVVGSIGGEWAVIGLARCGLDIPYEYFEDYYKTVQKYVIDKKGILHSQKHTEYSRVIIALTAIGKNPADVADYNLLMPLGDYEKTVYQGINGPIWALIALDCGNYDIPENSSANIQATRETYVNYILDKQLSDGGWALSGSISDPDVTAMALQALSKYQSNIKVKTATEKALTCLSAMQNESGGFSTYGKDSSESSVQILVALCELGISAEDTRFVKNGNTVLDSILTYYDGNGGFKHTKNGDTNQMATEQCFYALVAISRMNDGKNSLYSMSDARSSDVKGSSGLKGKNADVKSMPVIYSGKTFDDIKNSIYKTQIEALAARGIINGKTDKAFEPDSTMTRAEFATVITYGLGLPVSNKSIFKDVKSSDWYSSFVSTACSYGIINGVSETSFNPNGTITREEAATMVARAAKLCGHDTSLTTNEIRNILAGFSDYVTASKWSRESLAFCYLGGILDDSVLKINPQEQVTRAEIAYMLYNLLEVSNLIEE